MNGPIPWEVSKLSDLQVLRLNDNQLSGVIPSELGLLSNSVRDLWLKANKLEGTIPAELFWESYRPSSDRTYAEGLYLHDNALSGTIPTEVGKSKWPNIQLHRNALSGSIPKELSQAIGLEAFVIAGNNKVCASMRDFSNTCD